jgi:DNA-binding MarR family transcriptional regulator
MPKRLEELEPLVESLKKQHSDLGVDNSFSILRVSGLLDKFLDLKYRTTGLKRAQIMILFFLLANGGTMTPTELKSKVFRSDNAISKSLDNLDKLGLTKSSRTKTDRRLRKVTFTEKGLNLIKEILPLRGQLFSQATSILNKKESEELQAILQKVMDHLLKISGKKPVKKKNNIYF